MHHGGSVSGGGGGGGRRPAFLDAAPPAGYIAGLGRGAMGFTTRSDIGPAHAGPALPGSDTVDKRAAPLPPSVAAAAAAATTADAAAADDDERGEDLSDANYDAFAGYGGSLFAGGGGDDAEDRAADAVWAAVDERMDGRRRARRDAGERAEVLRRRAPKLQQQFADLKRALASVGADEWAAIPDAADQIRPRKRRSSSASAASFDQQQFRGGGGRFTPVPDALIARAHTTVAEEDATATTAAAAATTTTALVGSDSGGDLTQIGMTRSKLLDLRLSGASSAVGGQTVVDPQGYLTDLNALRGGLPANSEIGDVKKARLLLKSIRDTNPRHAASWVGSARLEEYAGQLSAARKIITEGTRMCPESEDVWLEAVRMMHGRDAGRSLLADAVRHLPRSVGVWLAAADAEDDLEAKKRVLRRALELVPDSVRLWKAAVQLEPPDAARVLLGRAVECVPQSADMWLALARLETHENARKVLNTAREKLPTEPQIWISAARLEEAHGNAGIVRTIVKRAIKSLRAHGVRIDREAWIAEAEAAEAAGAPGTCAAIVAETAREGLLDTDADRMQRAWKADAEAALSRGRVATARAIFSEGVAAFPAKKSLWFGLAQLEKQHGTREALDAVLVRAVEACPREEVLWLMRAKEQWKTFGNVGAARQVLQDAFAANPGSEAIWLAAVKLESENGEIQRARSLLARAREKCPTERVWRRSAQLEREAQGPAEEQRAILDEALARFPKAPKLWAMRAELAAQGGGSAADAAREVYRSATRACPTSVALWLGAARCEEAEQTTAGRGRARALLEKARQLVPKNAELWLEAVRVEARWGNAKVAAALMAKALQECPKAGVLWAEAVETSGSVVAAKSKAVDALKACDDDAAVIVAVARSVFLADHKVDKARSWLTRAVTLRPDFGDAWAELFRLEKRHGSAEQAESVLQRCVAADPRAGERWRAVAKAPGSNRRLATADVLQRVAAALP